MAKRRKRRVPGRTLEQIEQTLRAPRTPRTPRVARAKRRGRGPQKTATIGTRVEMLERQYIDIAGKPPLAARVDMMEVRAETMQSVLTRLESFERATGNTINLLAKQIANLTMEQTQRQNGGEHAQRDVADQSVPQEAA
jgi:hypothetical protein